MIPFISTLILLWLGGAITRAAAREKPICGVNLCIGLIGILMICTAVVRITLYAFS